MKSRNGKRHKEIETGRREAQWALFKGGNKALVPAQKERGGMNPSISTGEAGSSEDVSFRDDQIRDTLRVSCPARSSGLAAHPWLRGGRRAQLLCCWHRTCTRAVREMNFIFEPLLGTLLTCIIYSLNLNFF